MENIFQEEKQLSGSRSHPSPKKLSLSALQFRADRVFTCRHVPAYVQDIWLAAHLAIFNIFLARSRRGIYAGFIPFATPSALIACVHRLSMVTAKIKRPAGKGEPLPLLDLPLTEQ